MALIAHYRLDGDAKDSVGQFDGIENGEINWVDGKIGIAADFNGSYISAPEVSDYLHGKPEASIALWVKKDAIQYGFLQLSGYANNNGNLYPYQTQTKVYLDIFRTNRLGPIYMNTSVLEWHHVIITQSPGIWKLYQNGELVYTSGADQSVSTDYYSFEIGRNSGSRNADGKFDDVRIYDHALSEREVRDLSLAKTVVNILPEQLRQMSGTSGWTLSHHSFISSSFLTNVHGREHVHRVYWDGSSNGDWYSRYYIDPTTVGDVFYFSFDYLVTQGTDTPNSQIIYQDGWKGGGNATKEFLYDVELSDGWNRRAYKYTITTAGNPVFRMSTGYTSAVWEVYFDNFQLEKNSGQANFFVDGETFYPAYTNPGSSEKASIDSKGSVHAAALIQNPRARYIRDWLNGSTANGGNHWIEVRAVYEGVNISLNKPVTGSGSIARESKITDGNTSNSGYAYISTSEPSWVQVDLGEVREIDEIQVWHYRDGRSYYGTKTEISEDGVNWTVLFDSDIEGIYQEISAGKTHEAKALGPTGVAENGFRASEVSEIGPSKGLVAWYPLMGDTKDYASDLIAGGGHNGVFEGQDGILGASFDGTNYNRVEVSLTENIPSGESWSMCCWIYFRQFDNSNYPIFMSSGLPYLAVSSSGGQLRCSYSDGGQVNLTSSKSLTLNTWHHVVACFNKGDKAYLYCDGELVGTRNSPTSSSGISGFNLGGHGTTSYKVDGITSEARVYDRALSQEEIGILYNITNPNSQQKISMTQDTLYTKGQFKEVIA